ncbi:MAG: AI-2E family transporter [Gemmatimonadaceae bacterium]|nr:AI-2E family transporter [Gemmatimonadaceae bacterium]
MTASEPSGPTAGARGGFRERFGAAGRGARTTGWPSADIVRATALVTSYLLVLALLWAVRDIVFTAFLGVLFGLAVSAGAAPLVRWRIPLGIGAPLVVITGIALLGGIGAALAPTIRIQSDELRQRAPEALDQVERWLAARPGVAGLFLGDRRGSATVVAPRPPSAAPNGRPQRTQSAPPRVSAVPAPGGTTLRARVTAELSGTARYLFPFLSSTGTVVAGLFLILVLAVYIGADPALYHAGLMHLFPHGARDRAGDVLTRIATVLRRWLVTQLVAMVVVGVATTVTLLVLDVRAAVALGVIAALLEFVPTVGPILAAVPAIAMGLVDSPDKAAAVAIAYLVIQQLEGHLLIPLLMKEGMDLPPALTIVMQAVMALLFGFLGLMVAVPLLAVAIVPIKLLYVEDVVGDLPPGDGEPGQDNLVAPRRLQALGAPGA